MLPQIKSIWMGKPLDSNYCETAPGKTILARAGIILEMINKVVERKLFSNKIWSGFSFLDGNICWVLDCWSGNFKMMP